MYGIVYHVQSAIYLGTNVYKIGMSSKTTLDRVKVYGSKSEIYNIVRVSKLILARRKEI